jgi:hypothetical protein
LLGTFATTPTLLHEGDMAAPSTPKPARKSAAKPKRPAHLAHGRWLGDLEDEAPLSDAEKALVAACAKGEAWQPVGWDGKTRPNEPNEANTIRASLIRFLLLGGDDNHPVHEQGVMAAGAWISETLNVHQAHCLLRLQLRYCHLESTPDLIAATLPELVLSGCVLPGLQADRMVVKGDVLLDSGFTANDVVTLLGAEIGSNLECDSGSFTNVGGNAIRADGLNVKGDLFLRNQFNASGQVRLLGAEIGGNLECDGGTFTNIGGNALQADGLKVKGSLFFRDKFSASGTVRLLGAEISRNLSCIGGTFSNPGEKALYADGLYVKGGLFLKDVTVEGAIILAAGRIGDLIDNMDCWQAGRHELDGLHYDRINGPIDAANRIAWLEKQRPDHLTSDFRPQPWEQLIKVLREMGHPYDASEVAIAKQERMRKVGVIRGRVRKTMHWLYGKITGYGHRPIWTVYWMIAVWLFCGACFEIGREWGYFGPTSPLIHASAALEMCGGTGEGKPFWTSVGCPVPPEYTTMWPSLYSLDLLLPLVNLQQDVDWAPIVINGNGDQLLGGYLLRALLWFEILFGWAASLILVAVLGRLVEKD